jgi:hypothetical protein
VRLERRDHEGDVVIEALAQLLGSLEHLLAIDGGGSRGEAKLSSGRERRRRGDRETPILA